MDGSINTDRQIKANASAFDIQITGMTCSNCAGRVEKALNAVGGVRLASVNLASEKAHVEAVEGQTLQVAQLIEAVTEAGYTASYAPDATGEPDAVIRAGQRERQLLALSVVLTAPFLVQMLSMPTPWHFELPGLLQLLLASLVQFIPGSRFYGPAWRAMKAGTGNMDTLVVLGTSATWGLSTFLIWSHWPDIKTQALYFEASATVITLVLVGKFLETRARRNTASAIKSLMALRPDTARIRVDGTDREIPLVRLKRGDVLVIKPGERIAADAIIVEGSSHVDESLITGESLPVAKQAGQLLIGGAMNGEGLLLAEASAVGSDSKLAKIIHLVETAQVNKPQVQKLVDRIASYFVPFIIVIAVSTFAGWLFAGATVEAALIYAATVLVIACPCALGLATPTAIMVGTGVAAKSGILIRDMEALEQARFINCVVFDKTGTLTQGTPQVIHIETAKGHKDILLRQIAAAQQGSEHPLAKAMIDYASTSSDPSALPPVRQFLSLPGRGISAQVAGTTLLIGNDRLMQEKGVDTKAFDDQARAWEAQGYTVVWAADEASDQAIGIVAIGDKVRESSARAVARFKASGMETVLLSGDNPSAAQKVASEVGIKRVFAQVLPEEKAATIERLRADGHKVAMIGDGVNDAPALATAELGIAMGSGTDVAMETAGITLMRADPELAVDAIDISRATYGKIQQNLFWAFVYNVVAIPLAVFGILNPVIAGAAMAMSSVSVVSNSLLLKRWRGEGGSS